MISVQAVGVGRIHREYAPAGMFRPPTVIAAVVVSVVAALAPVRQTFPQGSRTPKMARPRTDGLPYETLIDAPPKDAESESRGDRIGIGRLANLGPSTARSRL